MAGMLPDGTSGGVVIRDGTGNPTNPANVFNAYSPPATFTSTAPLTALTSDCTARITPAQINGIASELLCIASTLNPTGNWNNTSLCNVATAITAWINGSGANSLGGALCARPAIAPGSIGATHNAMICDGSGNLVQVPIQALLQTAEIYVNGGSYNPATSILTLTDTSGTTPDVTINLGALLGVSTDAGNVLTNGTDG
ncbi:MAG: hypothetical protein ACRCYS_00175, partial [Beijerinckiaceae bacterium]